MGRSFKSFLSSTIHKPYSAYVFSKKSKVTGTLKAFSQHKVLIKFESVLLPLLSAQSTSMVAWYKRCS